MRVKHILKTYKEASGQQVNFDKSAIIFSMNTTAEVEGKFRACWVSRRWKIMTYIWDCQSWWVNLKKNKINCIRDRMWAKLKGGKREAPV